MDKLDKVDMFNEFVDVILLISVLSVVVGCTCMAIKGMEEGPIIEAPACDKAGERHNDSTSLRSDIS